MKTTLKTALAALFLTAAAFGGCEREAGEELGEGGELGAGEFGAWDVNRDGFLDENELRTGYGTWDRDRDGLISEQEFGGD